MPVNWRDMETEELGSVYESLLELTPRSPTTAAASPSPRAARPRATRARPPAATTRPTASCRCCSTGARPGARPRRGGGRRPGRGAALGHRLDPACGSGHFLLAAARRIATRLARARAGGVAGAGRLPPRAARRRARLHPRRRPQPDGGRAHQGRAVDRDGRARQAARLPRRQHPLRRRAARRVRPRRRWQQGIPDAAYKPLAGDDKETAKHFAKRNKAEREGQGSLDFAGGGGRLPAAAAARRRGHARCAPCPRTTPTRSPPSASSSRPRAPTRSRWNLRIAADLYVAAFLTPKTGGVPANRNTATIPTTAHVWDALAGRTLYGPLVGRAQDLAGDARAFHWPLEFPDIMAAGGFDVVLGNPPWERIKLQEQEFFAAREPEIAEAPNAAARGRLIAGSERGRARHARARALRRVRGGQAHRRGCRRSSRALPATTAAASRSPAAATSTPMPCSPSCSPASLGARTARGVIVPTGIATDATTAPFFGALD